MYCLSPYTGSLCISTSTQLITSQISMAMLAAIRMALTKCFKNFISSSPCNRSYVTPLPVSFAPISWSGAALAHPTESAVYGFKLSGKCVLIILGVALAGDTSTSCDFDFHNNISFLHIQTVCVFLFCIIVQFVCKVKIFHIQYGGVYYVWKTFKGSASIL